MFYAYDGLRPHQDVEWLRDWAAKITLTINIDEKTGLSPGLSLVNFFPGFKKALSNGEIIAGGRTLELGLGGSLASTATREQEITWFVTFTDLFEERRHAGGSCDNEGKLFIDGDLKIKEGLFAGVFPASLTRNMSDPFKSGGKLQVVQHQISFLIEASGNVTPAWHFVDVSANAGGPFLSSSRNRKDTLLITMGPTQLAGDGRPLKPTRRALPDERLARVVPSGSVEASHAAKQIGNAVGASLLGLR
ncbi:hypothetical protein [Methylobacterium sp. JK268]